VREQEGPPFRKFLDPPLNIVCVLFLYLLSAVVVNKRYMVKRFTVKFCLRFISIFVDFHVGLFTLLYISKRSPANEEVLLDGE